MERSLTAAMLTIGVVLGLTVGVAYAVARRSWVDYRKAKAGIPGARKAAWALIRVAVSKGGIVLLLCIAAVSWAATSDN
ncbi:hypothetical protein ACI2K4_33510 [Micromonospora sp. NPDC050397]|uniref:hypothetical protein n=1 Tax=Micromonospora sp. NPDC050397 TaxID=3364279 RepID=UPI00384BA563